MLEGVNKKLFKVGVWSSLKGRGEVGGGIWSILGYGGATGGLTLTLLRTQILKYLHYVAS